MWYHFALVVISLAMLGLAIGGPRALLRPAARSAPPPRCMPWFSAARRPDGDRRARLPRAQAVHDRGAPAAMFSPDVAVFYVVALAAVPLRRARDLGGARALSAAGERDLLRGPGRRRARHALLAVGLLEVAGAPAAILLGARRILPRARSVPQAQATRRPRSTRCSCSRRSGSRSGRSRRRTAAARGGDDPFRQPVRAPIPEGRPGPRRRRARRSSSAGTRTRGSR